MNLYRKNAVAAGILFLTAMVASLAGGGILESVLSAPDYLSAITSNNGTLMIGIFLELVNAAAVVGIAVTLFPILKQFGESLTYGYLGFRIIESVFCAIAAIIPLSVLSLSREFLNTGVSGSSNFRTLGKLLISARTDLAGLFIPIFFGLGALLFYYLLFRSKLVPRFIPVWGFTGAVLIILLCFVEAGMIMNVILVLPIISNEIYLGIWLIAKGFDYQAAAA